SPLPAHRYHVFIFSEVMTMSANRIELGPRKRFYFDGCPITQAKLMRELGTALLERRDVVIGGVHVMTNYIINMLRFVGDYGVFSDWWDDSRDHKFDWNNPTPGDNWDAVRELRRKGKVRPIKQGRDLIWVAKTE